MTTTICLLLLASQLGTTRAPADSSADAKPAVRALRLAQPAVIDGRLDEPFWQTAHRVTEFVQRDPNEGAAPTESTVVFVAYDDAAIYVGARLYDRSPDSIVARLGRRDAFTTSDDFTLYVDSYYDRRSGFYFGLDAAGTLFDGVLFNDDWDDNSWDGVWEGRTQIDAQGWSLEMRIPYSQLRFREAEAYTWGVNFRRRVVRKNESLYYAPRPKNASGFVSRFADLVGITGVTPPRRLEVLPYVTTRAAYTRHAPGDPFNDGSTYTPALGADLRVGLGSNLTLNATVNPDFGQVEVDPAVVNLSDVETFFQEKRPFFIEGSTIFDFGFGGATNYWGFNWAGPDFFYTRRLGRAPQRAAPGGVYAGVDTVYADAPEGANILGAFKLTGKLGGSWNVGTLAGVTARERADVDSGGIRFSREVEPLTYYAVSRVQKEFPEGRRAIGFMGTMTARDFDDPALRDLVNGSAFAGGLDGWTFLDADKEWVITGWVGASHVRGTAARMTALQHSSVHYFQRPDADAVEVDSNATSLTGWAARFHLNKQKGNWFSNSAIGLISPGFDANDLGFMFRTGQLNMHAGAGHAWRQPGKVFRAGELGGAVFQNYNWDGDVTWRGAFAFGWLQLLNYWSFNVDLAYNPETLSDRRTRGGPLTVNTPGYQFGLNVGSDQRKRVTFWAWAGTYYQTAEENNYWTGAEVSFRPAPNVSVSIGPNLSWYRTPAQYITAVADSFADATYDQRYVFADLDQTELAAGIRLNWTFSPALSLQLFAQPLISAGEYGRFKELARPRSFEFNAYGAGASTYDSTTYVADPDGPGGPAEPFELYNPDFNFKSLRGNAVLRWEYLPGSTLYVVWTQSRSRFDNAGAFDFGPSMRRLWREPADNIFMIKATYWWNP